ncbi:hypothetical protein ASE04_09785 [Rhizobium sp. Root708]|uniref:hypothetical protein n=1 Tax=Rhizobium sp. Root708 TaxID=1736592 RepID=UPI0006FA09B4|nr:hypothetical protein [Rhizobium sp. Root708]KRB51811.1 hypothetical protein ASE04_09785 [Rhizobium sp. Root708]
MAKTAFTLDDLQSDITHLTHILDEAVAKVLELDFEKDGKRNKPLDRLAAFLWIARDMAEAAEKNISENFKTLNDPRGAE